LEADYKNAQKKKKNLTRDAQKTTFVNNIID
jgi:hypothetical protein